MILNRFKNISKTSLVVTGLILAIVLAITSLGISNYFNQREFEKNFTPDPAAVLDYQNLSFQIVKISGPGKGESNISTGLFNTKYLKVKNYELTYLIKNKTDQTIIINTPLFKVFSKNKQINYQSYTPASSNYFHPQGQLVPHEWLVGTRNIEIAENNDEKNIYLEITFDGQSKRLNLFKEFPGDVDISFEYPKTLPEVDKNKVFTPNQEFVIKNSQTQLSFKLLNCTKDVADPEYSTYTQLKNLKCVLEVKNIGAAKSFDWDIKTYLKDNLHNTLSEDNKATNTANTFEILPGQTSRMNLVFSYKPGAIEYRLIINDYSVEDLF
ncbi:MAG: hypothetical protein WCK98_06280 [bacterium]